MNFQELIRKSRERHEKPLTMRRTVMHGKRGDILHPYHPQVFYARGKSTMATSFEKAGIGILPIMNNGYSYRGYAELGWTILRTMQHAEMKHWSHSYGIQIFTGKPSGFWTDLDFEWDAIEQHPEQLAVCIARLCSLTDTPLITITKSGGIRFSCRTPGYIHPKNQQEFVAEYEPELNERNQPTRKYLFMEVFGDKGLSRWDARYEIFAGNVFKPPEIPYESLFGVLSHYKRAVHVDPPEGATQKKSKPRKRRSPNRVANSQPSDTRYTLESLPAGLQWTRRSDGKPGLQSKRGDYPCGLSTHQNSHGSLQFYLGLDGVVDMHCHNCRENGYVGRYEQSDEERIQELIANAPPYEEPPTREQQSQWRIERIRSDEESPLAIQRPPPILEKQPDTLEYATLEINDDIIKEAFYHDSRIIVLNAETGAGKNFQLESFIIKGGKVLKTTPTFVLAVADHSRMVARGIDAFLWKGREHLWELQEKRTETELLAEPFINGAMCIDAPRCNSLFLKGGSPRRSICPFCPVYDTCKSEGYLSQEEIAINSEAVVISMKDLFFDPNRAGFASRLLQEIQVSTLNDAGDVEYEEVPRIGVIDEAKAHEFFLRRTLAKSQLHAWRDMWDTELLAVFSKDILNILEVEGFRVKRIRDYVDDIDEDTTAKINHQMQRVRVAYEIVDFTLIDKDTNDVLSKISMRFKDFDVSVYIAKDEASQKRLWEKDVACLPPETYSKDGHIALTLGQAIRFGIYSIENESDIAKLPWIAGTHTPLDQLNDMLTHYPYDINAPMKYDGENLIYYVPPVLSPDVENLVLMSATLNLEHTQRAFPDEQNVSLIETNPTIWKPGSRVFQIRTGAYPRKTILKYDKDSNITGLTDTGNKFLEFIGHNIRNDLDKNNVIITFKAISEMFAEQWKENYENLSFFGQFGQMEGLSEVFDEANTFWILGTPEIGKSVLQSQVNLLYGNDAGDISYERDDTRTFVDRRVQSVYEATVVALLQQAVGRARLNRFPNKQVVIFSGVHIPMITNRKETLLFDYADCEIASTLDQLEHWICKREFAEIDLIHEKAEIEGLLLDGYTSYSLIESGFSAYLVRQLHKELEHEIELRAETREAEIEAYVIELSQAGKPLREIERITSLTRYKIKKILDG